MALWGNSDSDESKPKWLTTAQKKEVFANTSGWVVEGGSAMTGNDNIAIVTAGSPRPGGRRLKRRLKDVEHYRFVHGNDIVPKTPPWLAGFVHTHPVIKLEDANDTRFDGVADHNMGDYYDAAVKYYS